MNHLYHINIAGKRAFSNLTEEEYFDAIEDLSQEYYETGVPLPSDISTEVINGDLNAS